MQTREVKDGMSLRSRSRCRWGSGGDLLRIGLRSGQQGDSACQSPPSSTGQRDHRLAKRVEQTSDGFCRIRLPRCQLKALIVGLPEELRVKRWSS
jgi:hypothetical protein